MVRLEFAAFVTDGMKWRAFKGEIGCVSPDFCFMLPSLGLVLATGLFAIALHPPYHSARWAWLKAATTLLILEGTLGGVQGTARDAAELARRVAAGDGDATAALQQVLTHERGATWVILLLALLNVALGVWRPRLSRRPRPEPPSLAG